MIARKDLIAGIHALWPHLIDGHRAGGHIFAPDAEYHAPHMAHVEELWQTQWRGKARYIREAWDCDDYALQFLATTRLYVAGLVWAGLLDGAVARPWAVGECWGTRFRGRDTGHAINIVRLSDGGLWLLEPQADEFLIWNATGDGDTPHYIRM